MYPIFSIDVMLTYGYVHSFYVVSIFLTSYQLTLLTNWPKRNRSKSFMYSVSCNIIPETINPPMVSWSLNHKSMSAVKYSYSRLYQLERINRVKLNCCKWFFFRISGTLVLEFVQGGKNYKQCWGISNSIRSELLHIYVWFKRLIISQTSLDYVCSKVIVFV